LEEIAVLTKNVLLIRAAVLSLAVVSCGSVCGSASQASPRYALKVAPQSGAAIAAQIDQRIVAQVGLAVGLQSSVFKNQLQILDALRSRVGVCIAAHHEDGDDHEDGDRVAKASAGHDDNNDDDNDDNSQKDGGGSFKLVEFSASGPLNITAIIEVYYDNECKKVFIHAPLKVQPTDQSSLSFTETATFFKPVGTILGKLTVNASGGKTDTELNLSGTGTFVPSNGGVHIEFGLDCSFPTILTGAKPFTCNGAVVASFNALKFDLGLLSTLTTKVAEGGCHDFIGSFRGTEQIVGGPFGKLGILLKDDSVKITGPSISLGTIVIAGTEHLGSSPSLISWTVTDTQHDIAASISVAVGEAQGFVGVIKDTVTRKALATFSVDQSGSGWMVFSNNQRGAITTWIIGD
jgi:hypothetical protein